MHTDRDKVQALAAAVVAAAEPGEQVEAYVARSMSTTVRAYDSEVESLTSAEVSGIGVRVIADRRVGFAHAAGLDPAVAIECLVEARDNARFAQPDEFLALVELDEAGPAAELDRWSETLAGRPVGDKIAAALRLERLTRGADPRVTGIRSAVYGDSGGEAALASTTGVRRWSRANRCSISVVAMAGDGDDATVGWANDSTRDPEDLDEAAVAGLATSRATGLLGAVKPPSGVTSIVLEPRLAASVLGIVAAMMSGERVLKGRTPFAGRIGEEVASPLLAMVDDPTDELSLAASASDGEGVASRPVPLVSAGVLDGFTHNTYTARRTGVLTTASAVRGYRTTPGVACRALHIAPGSGDLDGLVAGIDDGVLVQSMTGLHSGVNAVSGDFSVGVEGFAVRDGKVGAPLREATIAGSIQRMLTGITAIGADLTYLPSGAVVPSVVIEGVSLSGT